MLAAKVGIGGVEFQKGCSLTWKIDGLSGGRKPGGNLITRIVQDRVRGLGVLSMEHFGEF